MSQASASHTQSRRSFPSRLNLRTNVRDRLGPRPDIHARLGQQEDVHERLGSQGGQLDGHRDEDREERRSAARSQRNIRERIGPQGGQLDNHHNEDREERRSATRSRRTNSRRQTTGNPSQAQSTNTPPRQHNREGRPSQANEEVNQHRLNREDHQRDRLAMRAEDVEKLVNNRLRDLKIGGNFEDALRIEVDRANSSPFTVKIEQAAPPKRFSTPSFTCFKGDSDPESHLKHFKSLMILYKAEDALMCKVFAMTLRGAAQDWFHTLPSGSINSFKELTYIFTKEYTSYRTIKKNPDHLFNLRKKPEESLRDYIKRFKAEKANIVGCDDQIASSAFKKGLPAEHDLYRELTITPSQTLAEVFATAERYALWDDDRIAAKKSTEQEDRPAKRAEQRGDRLGSRDKDKGRPRPQREATTKENYTKFSIPIHQILAQVKDKPWVKRPSPLKGDPDKRDTRKYCAFHATHGHNTNNCFAWKAHLEELVREGHCTEFIARQAIQQIEDRDTAKEPPQKVIRINTILADSEESGTDQQRKEEEDQTGYYDLPSLN
ncbi:uncharacterized protein LOC117621818 [Prunus dulcis]|uniref:uncharacterized protein LOC117621818 n=1 Tax=Prunus dulcis TaxID=3755 RepID=UPI001482EED8|nr:uncharacterized protein LOC117621818 [Prunus dulcis]